VNDGAGVSTPQTSEETSSVASKRAERLKKLKELHLRRVMCFYVCCVLLLILWRDFIIHV
jgi:hypothetical protein